MMYAFDINLREAACQKISLLLIVAFESNPVAGFNHRFKQRSDLIRRHHFAAG